MIDIIGDLRSTLALAQSLKPFVNDKEEVALSQEQIDRQCSELEESIAFFSKA